MVRNNHFLHLNEAVEENNHMLKCHGYPILNNAFVPTLTVITTVTTVCCSFYFNSALSQLKTLAYMFVLFCSVRSHHEHGFYHTAKAIAKSNGGRFAIYSVLKCTFLM